MTDPPANPIDHIELIKHLADLGSLGVQIYRGAIKEANGDPRIARETTRAIVAALIHDKPTQTDESNEDDT